MKRLLAIALFMSLGLSQEVSAFILYNPCCCCYKTKSKSKSHKHKKNKGYELLEKNIPVVQDIVIDPREGYYKLLVKEAFDFKNSQTYGNISTILELIKDAKKRHEYSEMDLANFTLSHGENENKFLVYLIILSIEKYNRKCEENNLVPLSRHQLELNENIDLSGSDKQRQKNYSYYLVNMLGLKNSDTVLNHNNALSFELSLLLKYPELWESMVSSGRKYQKINDITQDIYIAQTNTNLKVDDKQKYYNLLIKKFLNFKTLLNYGSVAEIVEFIRAAKMENLISEDELGNLLFSQPHDQNIHLLACLGILCVKKYNNIIHALNREAISLVVLNLNSIRANLDEQRGQRSRESNYGKHLALLLSGYRGNMNELGDNNPDDMLAFELTLLVKYPELWQDMADFIYKDVEFLESQNNANENI